jgi:hypothetical protein
MTTATELTKEALTQAIRDLEYAVPIIAQHNETRATSISIKLNGLRKALAALDAATPEEPDAAGLYHRNVHREVGRARAAKTVKVGGKDAVTEAQPVAITEEMIDQAAREGYAVRCKTNGPRTLAQYASKKIMREEHENARVILQAGLAAATPKRDAEVTDKNRAFERWIACKWQEGRYRLDRKENGEYLNEDTAMMWEIWQEVWVLLGSEKSGQQAEVTDELPPLPKHVGRLPWKGLKFGKPVYTADQMREYARSHDQREGWISVKEQPIPHNERVLVQNDAEIAMAWLDVIDGKLYHAPQGGLVPFEPTYWLPLSSLPAAPKTSGGEK